MKHIITAAFFLVALTGCAAIDPIDPDGEDASAFHHFANALERQPIPLCFAIVADKHKGKLAKALAAAAEKHNEVAGKVVAVIADTGCAKTILVELSDECLKFDYEEYTYAKSCAPAWARPGEKIVFSENFLDETRVLLDPEKTIRSMMLHEMTHVFGLGHLPIINRYADCVMAGFIEGQDIDVIHSLQDEFCPAEAEAIRRFHQISYDAQVTATRASYEQARKGTHAIRYCGMYYTFINYPVVDKDWNDVSHGAWETKLEDDFVRLLGNINLNASPDSDECRHIVEQHENAIGTPASCITTLLHGLVIYHRYHGAGESFTMAAAECDTNGN